MKTLLKVLSIPAVIFLWGCDQEFSPKPRGYNRIDLPPHKYQPLKEEHPYTFEYSAYAEVKRDSSGIAEAHWIDLWYPQFKSNIQITYKKIGENKAKELKEYIDDSYRLKGGHHKKAYAVNEQIFKTTTGKTATLFALEGEVPSQYQFFITDSTQNFLRGALYFRTATKNDSLAPVINYMKEDIVHMLNTLEWKN